MKLGLPPLPDDDDSLLQYPADDTVADIGMNVQQRPAKLAVRWSHGESRPLHTKEVHVVELDPNATVSTVQSAVAAELGWPADEVPYYTV